MAKHIKKYNSGTTNPPEKKSFSVNKKSGGGSQANADAEKKKAKALADLKAQSDKAASNQQLKDSRAIGSNKKSREAAKAHSDYTTRGVVHGNIVYPNSLRTDEARAKFKAKLLKKEAANKK